MSNSNHPQNYERNFVIFSVWLGNDLSCYLHSVSINNLYFYFSYQFELLFPYIINIHFCDHRIYLKKKIKYCSRLKKRKVVNSHHVCLRECVCMRICVGKIRLFKWLQSKVFQLQFLEFVPSNYLFLSFATLNTTMMNGRKQ